MFTRRERDTKRFEFSIWNKNHSCPTASGENNVYSPSISPITYWGQKHVLLSNDKLYRGCWKILKRTILSLTNKLEKYVKIGISKKSFLPIITCNFIKFHWYAVRSENSDKSDLINGTVINVQKVWTDTHRYI